jgi:hypothetical protein
MFAPRHDAKVWINVWIGQKTLDREAILDYANSADQAGSGYRWSVFSKNCRFRIGEPSLCGESASDDHMLMPKGSENMQPYLLALILLIGLMRTAAATGPAGSTGVVATIPGSIVRWQPGDPVPPGVFSILATPMPDYGSPSRPVARPVGRVTRIRRQ